MANSNIHAINIKKKQKKRRGGAYLIAGVKGRSYSYIIGQKKKKIKEKIYDRASALCDMRAA
jgi:hypothetical protein